MKRPVMLDFSMLLTNIIRHNQSLLTWEGDGHSPIPLQIYKYFQSGLGGWVFWLYMTTWFFWNCSSTCGKNRSRTRHKLKTSMLKFKSKHHLYTWLTYCLIYAVQVNIKEKEKERDSLKCDISDWLYCFYESIWWY